MSAFSVLIVLCLTFATCNRIKNVGRTGESISYTIDTLKIETRAEFASSFNTMFLFKERGETLLFLSDPFQHLISIIDLKLKKHVANFYISDDGPDAVQNLTWIHVVGRDSILALTNNYVYIIDWRGKLINKKKVADVLKNSQLKRSEHSTFIANSNNVAAEGDNIIFVSKLSYRPSPAQDSFYENNLVCAYDYVNGRIYDLPILFPHEYRLDGSNYHLNSYPIISVHNRAIYYVYPFSSAVFKYEGQQTTKLYPINQKEEFSESISNTIPEGSIDKALYMGTSAYFNAIIFGDTNDLRYQIHHLKKDKFEDPTKYHIIVRNKDFEIIEKIEPHPNLSSICFAYENGLVFRPRDAEKQAGWIHFIRYNFKVNEQEVD